MTLPRIGEKLVQRILDYRAEYGRFSAPEQLMDVEGIGEATFEGPQGACNSGGYRMKILVVDDEKLLVKGIRFNLENEGYDVITGSDGMEAVELAGSENPDLIVLDLMMPRLDGWRPAGKSASSRMSQLLC